MVNVDVWWTVVTALAAKWLMKFPSSHWVCAGVVQVSDFVPSVLVGDLAVLMV